MTRVETELLDTVAGRVAKVLDVTPAQLAPDDDLEAVWGLDSLLKLEIVEEIEETLGRRFDDAVYEGCVSVRDIAAAITAASETP